MNVSLICPFNGHSCVTAYKINKIKQIEIKINNCTNYFNTDVFYKIYKQAFVKMEKKKQTISFLMDSD